MMLAQSRRSGYIQKQIFRPGFRCRTVLEPLAPCQRFDKRAIKTELVVAYTRRKRNWPVSLCSETRDCWMDAAGSMRRLRVKDFLDGMAMSMQLEELAELLALSS